MPDQTQMLGILSIPPAGIGVSVEPDDGTSVEIELGEFAAAAMRREKIGSISLTDDARAALIARVERAQAARGARLARKAWEARPVASAPAVGPDTVWSGDYDVLLNLFHLGLHRLNVTAHYLSERQHCAPLGFLAHEQP